LHIVTVTVDVTIAPGTPPVSGAWIENVKVEPPDIGGIVAGDDIHPVLPVP
jgi:arginine repressor